MPSVEKKLIYFGRRARNTGAEGAWAGIPHSSLLLAAEFRDSGGLDTALNTFDQSSYLLQGPGQHQVGGPVTAIAIAPDSPIESVDIHIGDPGGFNSHRIGVGSPFVGEIHPTARVIVTPTRPLPMLYRDYAGVLSTTAYRRSIVTWEMDQQDIDGIAATPIVGPLLPCRLNVYRGQVSILPERRAPYHASMVWDVDTGGTPVTPEMFVITDGRRRVRVCATLDTNGPASVTIWGVEGRKKIHTTIEGAGHPNPSGRIDRPVFDELLAATVISSAPDMLVFDYTGNPYQLFCVKVTSAVNASGGTLDLHAWDE
jgi:hypothetical protein